MKRLKLVIALVFALVVTEALNRSPRSFAEFARDHARFFAVDTPPIG
jgi:hypothetical protein